MKIRYLNKEEFSAANEARMALARKRNDGKGASLFEITGGGVGWYSYWYYHAHEEDREEWVIRERARAKTDAKMSFLSKHYWNDWSHTRPPISVLCPNGMEWCVDQVSSNGTGWVVTGSLEDGTLTASPSIDVPGYHGWLGINGPAPGHFSKDLNGARGPDGYGIWPYPKE